MTPPVTSATALGAGDALRPGASRADEAVRRAALRAPVIVAPMYLLSGPELVVASCRAGLMGSLPASNARTPRELDGWLARIAAALGELPDPRWAVSLIVHRGYDRFGPELELIAEHRPHVVLTALGSPRPVVSTVRGYGGAVFATVASVEQALKAVDAGADGLVLECRAEGGIPGRMSPRVFVDAIRGFFDGPVVVGGGISTGRGVRAVQRRGADLAYVGRRFAACPETRFDDRHPALLARVRELGVADTASMTGVPYSWLSEGLGVESVAGAVAESVAESVAGAGELPGPSAGGTATAGQVADRIVREYLSALFQPRVSR